MGINESSLIHIEIDGIEFKVKSGSKIIEIADDIGVYIPRFCYHKKLSISANCRMCLVEIEKAPKLAPACATPVMNGMKIFTNTQKVMDAQRSVMEFLLINHPLDCPVCDQGGECELQDLTIGYGCSTSRFIEKKRVLNDYDLGPLIATDITRCILCSRCVRFCSEIAGKDEFGIIGRGSDAKIFTFLKEHIKSELSGNVIDLCPVGSLTAKPQRNKLRAWELVQHSFISLHDCVGSNLFVHTVKDEVVRIVPKRNEKINESWISDRDRFSYEGLNSQDRLKFPMIKINGKWLDVSWTEALQHSVNKLNAIKCNHGVDEISILASPNSTLEEFYILQKLFRTLGIKNFDHRLQQVDFSEQEHFPIYPGMSIGIDEIETQDLVFLIGTNIVTEQPIIGLKVRKVANNSGNVFTLNPVDYDLSMCIKDKYIVNLRSFIDILTSIIKSVLVKQNKKKVDLCGMEKLFDNIEVSKRFDTLVDKLLNSKNKLIILGFMIYSSPDFSKIISLCSLLKKLTGINLGVMTPGSNSVGAWLSGFIPHRLSGGKVLSSNFGLHVKDMFLKKLKCYVLFGIETEHDLIYDSNVKNALCDAEFVLSFTSFKSRALLETSDVLLPISSSYENSGTFINISGLYQSFISTVSQKYDIKQGWKVICDLANMFKCSGFIYKNVESILLEVKNKIDKTLICEWKEYKLKNFNSNIEKNKIIGIPMFFLYDSDSLVRRANSLQNIYKTNSIPILKCNEKTYSKFKLKNNIAFIIKGSDRIKCFIEIDKLISDDSIYFNSNCIKKFKVFSFLYKQINLSDK